MQQVANACWAGIYKHFLNIEIPYFDLPAFFWGLPHLPLSHEISSNSACKEIIFCNVYQLR
jgi:hypothetical protein